MDKFKKVGLAVVTGGANMVMDQRGQQKLLETGTPARAVVKEFRQQWDTHSDDALVSRQSVRWGNSQMTLEVHPAVGEPYAWSGEMWVRVKRYNALPGEFVGSEVPVKVDPADPQKVAVDWDAAAAEAGVQ